MPCWTLSEHLYITRYKTIIEVGDKDRQGKYVEFIKGMVSLQSSVLQTFTLKLTNVVKLTLKKIRQRILTCNHIRHERISNQRGLENNTDNKRYKTARVSTDRYLQLPIFDLYSSSSVKS